MGTFFEYRGAVCGIGLSWDVAIAGEFSRKQLIARRRRFGATHFVAHTALDTSTSTRSYGFGSLPKLTAAQKGLAVFSFASCVARMRKGNFCAIVQLGEHDGEPAYGFVGILQGQPVIGFDIAGTGSEIAETAHRFLDQNPGADYLYLKSFGTSDLILAGRLPTQLDDSAANALGETDRACALLPLPSNVPVYAGMALLGLVASGLAGAMFLKAQRDAEAELARNTVSTEVAYQRSRDAAFLADTRVPASLAYASVANPLLDLPVRSNGWTLDKVSCAPLHAETVLFSCRLKWSGNDAAFETFRSPVPGAKLVYDVNLVSIEATVDASAGGIRPLQIGDIAGFPNTLDFVQRVGSTFQYLKTLGFTPSLTGLKPVGQLPPGVSFPAALHSLEWSLKGPASQMDLAMRAMPSSMVIGKLEITVPRDSAGTELEITTSGIVYVR